MKIYKYLFLFFCASFFISCENELHQDPQTNKTATNYYSTEKEMESAVTAAYSVLQRSSLYGLYLPALGDVLSDNCTEEVASNDGGIFGQLDLFTTTHKNKIIEDIWKNSYVGIQFTNIVLNRIEKIKYKDDKIKRARSGEMLFLRALHYFNLVRIYGGVPIVLKETSNPSDFFGQDRNDVSQVYDQIVLDLKEAIDLLPINEDITGRVTKGAAQALLGKVLMTKGDLQEAKIQFEAVIASAKYQLMANINDVFSLDREYNNEILFAVKFQSNIASLEGSDAVVQYSPSTRTNVKGGKGHNIIEMSLYKLYAPTDKRIGAYVAITEEKQNKRMAYNLKWKPNSGTNSDPNDGGSDVVVIRYADVLLLLAEIEAKEGSLTKAKNLLNQVRNRAGLSNITSNITTEVSDAIELERRLEFVCEGHRWFDLLRTNLAVSTMNTFFTSNGINIIIDDHNLLMPIPLDQINADPGTIDQNPGY